MRSVAFVLALAMSAITAPVQNSSLDNSTILSDTQGYNFGPYMNSLFNRVRQNWYAVMPEIAVKGQKGRAVVKFTIVRDGKVKDLQLVLSAGDQALDNAAQAAIKVSSPLPPLPEGFKGDQIVLQLSFLYNLKGADR